MSELINLFRNGISSTCFSNSGIRKEGCRVLLKNVPQSHLVIDFDKPGSPFNQNQIRCDYLFVAELPSQHGIVAPLELKNKNVDVSKVKQQLEAGAKVAEKILPSNVDVEFEPILASTSLNIAANKALKKKNNRVGFRNHFYPIKRMKCNSPLRDVI